MASIYLASQSPRRKEILKSLGVNFKILTCNHKEEVFPNENVLDFVERNTKEKALNALALIQAKKEIILPVLTADTVVSLDNQIFGKPRDKDHCISMLLELSGRSHKVYSCIVIGELVNNNSEEVNLNYEIVESEVLFRQLTAEECQKYWDTGEPNDKAGGYAIQGYGAAFVERIIGSYSNIVGLPIFETCRILESKKISFWLK